MKTRGIRVRAPIGTPPHPGMNLASKRDYLTTRGPVTVVVNVSMDSKCHTVLLLVQEYCLLLAAGART